MSNRKINEEMAQEQQGYWGKRTATIDWCESNYEVTNYIAEFWNTISNFVMILFPLYAVYWSFKHRQAAKKSKSKIKFIIPNSTIYCQLSLLLVGIGSWMFHMTLLYPMQLLDELPMLYCSAFLIYASYDLILSARELNQKRNKKDLKKSRLVEILETRSIVQVMLLVFCLVVSCMYLSVMTSPIFHEIAYAFMVFIIIFESMYLLKLFKSTIRISMLSLIYYGTGFIFWNIDNHFCDYLKSCRDFLDTKLGIDGSSNFRSITFNVLVVCLKSVFEFHSLWHIFVGFGTYTTILFFLESNYQLHLSKTDKIKANDDMLQANRNKKVISSKYANMYYHLTNELLEKERNF